MALTNVAMWTDKGWKGVTIDEATKIFPSTVHAHSGMLICRLCKKYITLTAPGKKARCFKHNRGDTDKECDDRALSSPIKQFEMHEFIPPIRINIANNHLFFLEMGFVLPPALVDNNGTIIIKSNDYQNNVFRYDISRLCEERLTYLNIGNVPSEKYLINVVDSQITLPNSVNGIKDNGVLFDKYTGKKLPDDADVIVDYEYILITKKTPWQTSDMIISQVCSAKGWYAYQVRAKTLNRSTANFFFNYGYLLTEKQASLTFLWPEYIISPYVLKHDAKSLHLYIQGESITPKIFPEGDILSRIYCDNDNGVAVTVKCSERQQLLSAGRTKVLRYTYLWKEKLDSTAKPPNVIITNIKGIIETSGVKNTLPEKKILQITPEYDGFIEIKKDNWLIEKRKLIANVISEIDQLQYGMSINVFQGLECVWSVSYVKTERYDSQNETELLRTLQNAGGKMISISHLFGATAKKYEGYPLVQRWIYSQIRNGFISEKAYKIMM
ncbi:MAG: hypothetical protein ACI4J2_02320 [Ruminococcus sp.]